MHYTVKFQTLMDMLIYQAGKRPDKISHCYLAGGETKGREFCFEYLNDYAAKVAALLQGNEAWGKRALLFYPAGLDFVAAFFGCLYAGVVAVPTYPPRFHRTLPDRLLLRLRAVSKDSGPAFVLTTARMLDKKENLFREAPEFENMRWLATDELSDELKSRWKRPDISGNTVAFLQYTSGSTSLPKGVMVSHENLLHNIAYISHAQKNDNDSVSVSWLPGYHDMGLIDAIIQPAYVGFTSYLMSPVSFIQKPLRWLKAVSDYRATSSGGPNFAFDLCNRKISAEEREQLDLSSLRFLYNGAEPVRKKVLETFYNNYKAYGLKLSSLNPVYGMAEATLMISSSIPSEEPVFIRLNADALKKNRVVESNDETVEAVSLVGCGKVFFGMEACIVNPKNRALCADDEIGEIWVSGPSVTKGYWRNSEYTDETFNAYPANSTKGPYLRTGDLGFIRNGQVFITGRIKDLIIIRGRNYYPQDIECAVENSALQSLRQNASAAFTVDINDEERLIIVTEVKRQFSKKGTLPDKTGTIRKIRNDVSYSFQVNVYDVVLIKATSLPKTSSGKVRRRDTKRLYLEKKLVRLP